MIEFDLSFAEQYGKKFIDIRGGNYATAFWLEDGKKLSTVRPDGTKSTHPCRYIDSHHFFFGTNCFHIDQFADLVRNNKLLIEPEEYVTDLRMYRKIYVDRKMRDLDGKPIPYRGILSFGGDDYYPSPFDFKMVAVCPDTIIGKQVCLLDSTGPKPAENIFYSVPQALNELLPTLDVSEHERKLLRSILENMDRQIPRISQKEFDAIGRDYRDVYHNYDGKHPEWEGKRTAFLPGRGTTLYIEGVSFLIEDERKPSLCSQVKAAEAKCEESHNSAQRAEPEPQR